MDINIKMTYPDENGGLDVDIDVDIDTDELSNLSNERINYFHFRPLTHKSPFLRLVTYTKNQPSSFFSSKSSRMIYAFIAKLRLYSCVKKIF